MKKITLLTLLTTTSLTHCMEIQKSDTKMQIIASKIKNFSPVTKAALGYPLAAALFYLTAQPLYNYSGADCCDVPRKGYLEGKLNVYVLPKNIHSENPKKQFSYTIARGLLTMSSICAAPYRSLELCCHAYTIMRLSNMLKKPEIMVPVRISTKNESLGVRVNTRRAVLKAPIWALFGFGIPYLYGKYKDAYYQ